MPMRLAARTMPDAVFLPADSPTTRSWPGRSPRTWRATGGSRCVGVKVRFKPFFTQIHAVKLPAPTTDLDVLTSAALRVLEQFDHDRPVRLLGVRFEYTPQTG